MQMSECTPPGHLLTITAATKARVMKHCRNVGRPLRTAELLLLCGFQYLAGKSVTVPTARPQTAPQQPARFLLSPFVMQARP